MGSTPKAPNYAQQAQLQGEQNAQLNAQQTWANRPNQTNPWGSSSWSAKEGVDPATGKPITEWSQNVTLDPEMQRALDAQQGLQAGRSELAGGLMDQLKGNYANPFDYGSLDPGGSHITSEQMPQNVGNMAYSFGAPAGMDSWRQAGQEAAWNWQKPQLEESRSNLESRLANQGVTEFSKPWQTAMREQGDAETRARMGAMEAGRAEAGQMFGQGLQSAEFQNKAQQQQWQQLYDSLGFNVDSAVKSGMFNEQLRGRQLEEGMAQRNQPLQDINALLQGQTGIQAPNFENFTNASQAQGADLMGAASSDYEARVGQANAKKAQNTQMASMAMMAAVMF